MSSSREWADAINGRRASLVGTLETRLEEGYLPHPFDVICKSDRDSVCHIGNKAFRLIVESRVNTYILARSRNEKTMIIKEIIDAVRSSGGRFIRQQEASDRKPKSLYARRKRDDVDDYVENVRPVYLDIGYKKAADKVGHAMRLALSKRDSCSGRRKSWPPCSSTRNEKVRRVGALQEPLGQGHVNSHSQSGNAPDKAKRKSALPRSAEANNEHEKPNPVMERTRQSSNRRQSWHAGSSSDDDTHRNSATCQERCLSPSVDSLSSQAWDLNNLQGKDDVADLDAYSFGTISLEEYNPTTSKRGHLGAHVEPPQVIAATSAIFCSQEEDDLSLDGSSS